MTLSNNTEARPENKTEPERQHREAILLSELVDKEITFPSGILGFPEIQRYRLERFPTDGDQATPFLVLGAVAEPLSFPLIHPDFISLDYHVPIFPGLLTTLNAGSAADLVPLLIVTVRDRLEDITVNLQGPLIVNPASARGLQLVVEEYPLRHPLLIQQEL